MWIYIKLEEMRKKKNKRVLMTAYERRRVRRVRRRGSKDFWDPGTIYSTRVELYPVPCTSVLRLVVAARPAARLRASMILNPRTTAGAFTSQKLILHWPPTSSSVTRRRIRFSRIQRKFHSVGTRQEYQHLNADKTKSFSSHCATPTVELMYPKYMNFIKNNQ